VEDTVVVNVGVAEFVGVTLMVGVGVTFGDSLT
jgi:hypothetical protein